MISVVLGAKFYDDLYYSNAYYAKVGGVKINELNSLEAVFLQMIDFRLHVTPEEFEHYKNHVLLAVGTNRPNCPSPSTGPDSPQQQFADEEGD